MNAAAEQLFDLLPVEIVPRTDHNTIRNNILALQDLDNRFITRAMELAETGDYGTLSRLHAYLDDPPGLTDTATAAYSVNEQFGTNHNAATLVMEVVARMHSLRKLMPLTTRRKIMPSDITIGTSRGDRLIMKIDPDLRPYMFSTPLDDLDRYFHPLAVASTLLDAHNGRPDPQESFAAKAPAFIAWAGEHPEMEAVLDIALEYSTVNVQDIEALLRQTKETEPAFRSGIL